jgi:hypothetical protein
VKKASEYREHADECRQLAKKAATADHRAVFENMARTWETLAKSREQRILRERRMEVLEQRSLTHPRG